MSKRIVVVDDQTDLLTLLRMLLEDQRYQVSVLKDGRGSVEYIRANQPDLVILDLKLTDVPGLDILQSLKGQTATADIPVIVYSAAVVEAEAVSQMAEQDPARYGTVAVLLKPFELDELLERVGTMLGAADPG
ncbi:MAG TPA: response regulator [Ktedonobacterales bacterium]